MQFCSFVGLRRQEDKRKDMYTYSSIVDAVGVVSQTNPFGAGCFSPPASLKRLENHELYGVLSPNLGGKSSPQNG